MTRSAKSSHVIALSIIPALALLCLRPSTARADSLTLSAQFLGGSTVLCSSSSNPATCGVAQATGSLATGTIGVAAKFPPGGLPLPSFSGQTTDEAVASATLIYNFTSSVSSGTAVVDLSITGSSSVSNTGFPSSICPAATPCLAHAGIGGASDESFAGAAPGVADIFANILNSGSTGTPGLVQVVVPISGGKTNLLLILGAAAECPALTPLQRAEGLSCSAVADYLDPLQITGASLYDSTGNLVPGATLVSESGFTLISAATPEPSSILLLGTGISLLSLIAPKMRGRRRNRHG